MKRLISIQQIESATDLPEQIVPVPEWDADVRLVCLSAIQRLAWEREAFQEGKVATEEYLFGLLQRTIVDDEGNPVFAGDEGREALGKRNSDVLNRLQKVAAKLNGIGKDAAEDLEKNSDASRADAGSSS
jgi:hypothetical protein